MSRYGDILGAYLDISVIEGQMATIISCPNMEAKVAITEVPARIICLTNPHTCRRWTELMLLRAVNIANTVSETE